MKFYERDCEKRIFTVFFRLFRCIIGDGYNDHTEGNIMTIQMIYVALELWGAVFLGGAAFFLFSMVSDEDQDHFKALAKMMACFALMLLTDSFAWGFRGEPGEQARVIIAISNFMSFALNYVTMMFFTNYLASCIGKKVLLSRPVLAVHTLCTIEILLLIVSQFTDLFYYFDENNYYHRAPLYLLCQIFVFAAMIIDVVLLIYYRKRLTFDRLVSFLSFMGLPVVLLVVQFFVYGFSLTNIGAMISCVLIFLQALVAQNQRVREQSIQIIEQEKALSDMQVRIVMSQIKPHFLYNSLNTIYYLCDIDPERAQEAISNFSDYLRGNMASIASSSLIPFRDELKHTKTYLHLEKMRFEDELNIHYELDTVDFDVPPLTLQPIVENAIKHGIGKRRGGGDLWIRTLRLPEGYQLEVEDNGIGFDVSEIKDGQRTHIGASNVRNRIRIQLGGEMEVRSEIGKGTRVTITIPQQTGGE